MKREHCTRCPTVPMCLAAGVCLRHNLGSTAKEARDEALERVTKNERKAYRDAVYEILDRLPAGRYTGESIRLLCEKKLGPAHHHNFWGAACHTGITKGWLIDTGETAHMKTRLSHARKTPVYEAAATELLGD